MKTLLRRLGVLALFSKTNIFSKVRIQLVVFYAFIFLITIFAADSVVGKYRSTIVENVIEQSLTQIEGGDLDRRVVEARRQVLDDFRPWKYTFYAFLGLLVAGAAYLLTNASLYPINTIVESQKRFIANASHELRTPLSIMKTQSEVALRMRDNLSKNEIENVLRNNVQQIAHMSEIISALLRVSDRLTSAKDVELSTFRVLSSVNNVLNSTFEIAKTKNIHIVTNIEHSKVITWNSTIFEEILTNIIQNAIWYTPHGGTISMEIDKRNGNELIISDNGIGISKDDLPHVFDPFFRGSTSRNYYTSGSGLGLTIVKELLTIHNGSISLESYTGKGTTVKITFPNIVLHSRG